MEPYSQLIQPKNYMKGNIKMKKCITFVGKFWLKSGQIIEEKETFDETCDRKKLDEQANQLKQDIKDSMLGIGITKIINFGGVFIDVDTIAAVKIVELGSEDDSSTTCDES